MPRLSAYIPEADALSSFAGRLEILLNGNDCEMVNARHELVIHVPLANLRDVLSTIRDDSTVALNQLTDITAVDYPERPERYDVVYQLLSVNFNQRVRVIVAVNESDLIPSVVDLFASANWAEREVWDMFGLFFAGHPDLRRLLTDYGFEGHPLRKDFPLTGYVEVRYDDTERRVLYEPVQLTQEFRDFDFLSPWEGVQASLPDTSEDEASDKAEAN